MFDSTVHAKTLARHIRISDFEPGIAQISPTDKAAVIERALLIADRGFQHIPLRRNEIAGKDVYQHRRLEEALLTRHVSENVRRVTSVKQSDRQNIVRSLAALASEGVPFFVCKMDIRSFYESVETDVLIDAIKRDAAFSRQSVGILESFFSALKTQNISGLPRGLSLSATLAEYLMRPFDASMSRLSGVRYYSRYVDDIIVVAAFDLCLEDVVQHARTSLPAGLNLNRSKTKGYSFRPLIKQPFANTEHIIEFLGYRFDIGAAFRDGDNIVRRRVVLDIAEKKVKRLKRRISKSLLEFNAGGTFDVLLGRIKLLTSNFSFIDSETGQTRFSGLRYNYPLIDADQSEALLALDRFLLNAVTSRHPGNRIRPSLSKSQQASILGLTFKTGYIDNRFFTYSKEELRQLSSCWVHA